MDKNNDKIRVVILLTEKGKAALEVLAWRSGGSMSGYIRHLVVEEIICNRD